MMSSLCHACGCSHGESADCSVCCYTLKECVKNVLLLGPRLVKATAQSTIDVLQETFQKTGASFCKIPETHCPPRCICAVDWCGSVGDRLTHHVVLTNSGKHRRNFELVALPFSCTEVKVRIHKDFATLAPGESLKTSIEFTIPEGFAGQTLMAEVLVRGAYEQSICITLDVKSIAQACCDIHQGEIPTRIKAHQWFHHFQCEVPCFDAIAPVRPDQADMTSTTAPHHESVVGEREK